MKLEINEIYHNYIVKVVIFALFTFKRQIRQPNVYKASVDGFIKRRIPWKINLIVDTGIKLEKDEERELILQELLEGIETDYFSSVIVTFDTPLKKVTICVDLSEEERYQSFIYS